MFFKFFVLVFLFLTRTAWSLEVGDTMTTFKVRDQFDQEMSLTTETKVILYATNKANGEQVQDLIGQINQGDYLSNNGILYVANMVKAPSLVLSYFMLPAFKKYPNRIGLITEEEVAKQLPSNENKLTLIRLEKMKVKDIIYLEKISVDVLK